MLGFFIRASLIRLVAYPKEKTIGEPTVLTGTIGRGIMNEKLFFLPFYESPVSTRLHKETEYSALTHLSDDDILIIGMRGDLQIFECYPASFLRPSYVLPSLFP